MTIDYYSEARRLASLLEQEGLTTHAGAITEVLEGGSTASEILMGLRFHIDRASKEASQTTARQLLVLSGQLSKALG